MSFVSFVKGAISPDGIPPPVVLIVCTAAFFIIFGFDWRYGSSIWLHQLYLFPLAALAFYVESSGGVAIGIVVAGTLQLLTLLSYKLLASAVIMNFVITFTADMTMAGIARAARVRFAEIETAAAIDPLTKLLNRRGFESMADREISRQRRYGGIFSLAVLDLDRFKELNDSRGHEIGDRALSLLATILRSHSRDSDVLGRLGGDEFVIMMPNTGLADCNRHCQQLTASIASGMAEAGFSITASIGCAAVEEPPDSLIVALRKADKAMFAAKARHARRDASHAVRHGRVSIVPTRHGPR